MIELAPAMSALAPPAWASADADGATDGSGEEGRGGGGRGGGGHASSDDGDRRSYHVVSHYFVFAALGLRSWVVPALGVRMRAWWTS